MKLQPFGLKKEFLLLLLALSASVLGVELIVSVISPQPTLNRVLANTPAMFCESKVLPYALRPGYQGRLRRREFNIAIIINSQGYRNREFARDKGSNFRALCLGDSFTFGWGVQGTESYPARMAALFHEQYGDENIELINAGFASGYSPDTYYLYLREFGLNLKPDLILIGFFIGNDIDGYHENVWLRTDEHGLPLQIDNIESRVDENGYFVARKQYFAYSIPVLRNSHLFHLVGSAFRQMRHFFGAKEDTLRIYHREYQDQTIASVERTQKLFSAIHEIASGAAIPVAVILIPTREQLYRDPVPISSEIDLEKPQRLFREFFDKQGIAYLDLLPAMGSTASLVEFYFPEDQHWNPKGHSFAATQIVKYLIKINLFRR